MKYHIYLLLLSLFSCGQSSEYGQTNFDRDIWLANTEMEDTDNPRARMTEDLLNNHLKSGLSRNQILSLLGKPYEEKIENRLKEGLSTPDSLISGKTNLGQFNEWFAINSQPDTLLFYPVGWSLIDPNFLVIKMKPDSTCTDFWVEQH